MERAREAAVFGGVIALVLAAAAPGCWTDDGAGNGATDSGTASDAPTAIDGASGDFDSALADAHANDGIALDASSSDASSPDTAIDASLPDPTGGACRPFTWSGSYKLRPGHVCSTDGVCMISPTFRFSPRFVWAAAPGDVWFATGPGVGIETTGFVHFVNGVATGLTGPFTDLGPIYGSGPDDVWIGKLHWNGATITKDAAHAPPGAATYFGKTDGWAVHGTMMAHWNGATWTDVATPATKPLDALWGAAPNDVYAVGETSTLHWNGIVWSDVAIAGLPAGGTAIWGRSATDIFMTSGAFIYRILDGVATAYPNAAGGASYIGGDATHVWLRAGNTIHHFDPRWGVESDINGAPNAITYSCICETNVNAVPYNGCTALATLPTGQVYTATNFTRSDRFVAACGAFANGAPLNTRVTAPPEVAVSKTTGGAFTLRGGKVQDDGVEVAWGFASDDQASRAEGRADNDVWVFGGHTVGGTPAPIASHWNGIAWKPITLPTVATDVPIDGSFHGRSATSAWMILAHHAYYWNGLTWTDTGLVPTASEKPGIWGNGGSSAIVVGDDVYRWNGAAWSRLAFPKSDFFAVGHGTDPSRVVLLRDGEGFPQKPPAVVLWNGGAQRSSRLRPPRSTRRAQATSTTSIAGALHSPATSRGSFPRRTARFSRIRSGRFGMAAG